MLPKKVFTFLHDLQQNNDREWFNANKSVYQEARKAFADFINLTINEIRKFDKDINGIEAKDCMLRIYRDVRFSHDKSPYKTNFGAYIAAGGRKSMYAGYYVHLEPGAPMLAGGLYMPPPPQLKIIRQEIYENIDEFREIIEDKNFKQYFGSLTGDQLKKGPRDFPADFPDIDLLKFKSYNVARGLTEKDVESDNILEMVHNTFKAMYPLNRFFNYALENAAV